MTFFQPGGGYDATCLFGPRLRQAGAGCKFFRQSSQADDNVPKWMPLKAYGNSDPTPDKLLLKGQVTSLGLYKMRYDVAELNRVVATRLLEC
jgi:hypothetical protein